MKDELSSWDLKYLELAKFVATWSKDTTKVGCVIVSPENKVRSIGYNGFPRGVEDNVPERHERPAKYKWTEHAERNAIYNAERNLKNCTIYLEWFPCADCARAIIQSGISTMIAGTPDVDNETWGEDFKVSLVMLLEAHVDIIYHDKD